MTTRFCFAVVTLFSPTLALFAHDGDHTGMGNFTITLHHAALPIAAAVIVLASIIISRLRHRSSRQKLRKGSTRSRA